jgi:citrate synthase
VVPPPLRRAASRPAGAFPADAAARPIPQAAIDIIDRVKAAHPMDILRTAVSAVVALDESSHEASVAVALPVGKRLISQVATIVAAMHRLRSGLDPVAPRDDLSHAANFLYMMSGKEPTQEHAKIIDLDMVLHAEHSSNASTFAARRRWHRRRRPCIVAAIAAAAAPRQPPRPCRRSRTSATPPARSST